MLRKILFPTDFSDYAWRTFECIEEFPDLEEVVLLHVVEVSLGAGPYQEHAKAKIAELKDHLEARGVKVEALVPISMPVDEILKVAEEENVDLILIGARGKGLVRRALLGSVSRGVIRQSKRPVLVMRHNVVEDRASIERFCPNTFQVILHPTDFSDKSIEFLRGLKRVGRVVLLHVVDRGETYEEIEELRRDAQSRLKDLAGELEGVDVDVHVHVGDPPSEILKVADEEDVTLILMGAGERGLTESLLGSTAEEVVRRAERPVLIVPGGVK